MGENTKIEWADHTFNPWIGCAKVSTGCLNCYAERDMDHRFGKVKWGPRGTRVKTSAKNWAKPRQWNKRAQANGRVETVFCASLADVFEEWPGSHLAPHEMDDWREELFQLMEETPWLVWLVLTKRPQNVLYMVPDQWYAGESWPANVWLGFSAEDQGNFDFRMDSAIYIPTPVLWISAEPLLGEIRMWDYLETGEMDWVIAGGESGPEARPTHKDWVDSLRDQCHGNDVPFFFKQWGEWLPAYESTEKYSPGKHEVHVWEDQRHSLKIGRQIAGRLLEGRTHNTLPEYLYEYESGLRGVP